jgi:hypothetical protein
MENPWATKPVKTRPFLSYPQPGKLDAREGFSRRALSYSSGGRPRRRKPVAIVDH